ncbi:PREDICTED: probable receptor-like protein kinase At5g47070 [Tarenaya hassleriana]|uniref:probable receptor-like protein kinase At5g47070 n=1 Tax=Tarenaya hassleriana TaxID=28532 RepID=UPI00053C8F45|nr:PREDICTED: probable receptor-like protein kinase At5g47070 [Tarenaya hassleriana]
MSNSTSVRRLVSSKAMKCFYFSKERSEDEPKPRKLNSSLRSSASMSNSTEGLGRGSGSDFSSRNISETSTASSAMTPFADLSRKHSNNLRMFELDELKMATKNFSRSLMIGEGGFGGVFRGMIQCPEDSRKKIEIAVKQLSRRGLQGHKEWVTEVNVLGVVEHPNLVKLIGYCAEDDERGIQRILVYEYVPNRSVQDHLSNRFLVTPLPWSTRLKIALDTARGLAYLHEGMEFQIIFRDFKSSNILLDENWNAKLSDFGLARMGPSEGITHVSTAVVGTIGYAAPEYLQTGHLTAKSDVWSYGIFLYELITGRRPFDRNRPRNEQNVLEWIRPHLSDIKKFKMIVDPRLGGNYCLKSALKLAAVANRCLMTKAKSRPRMSQVLEMIDRIAETSSSHDGVEALPLMKSLTPKDAFEASRREGAKRRFVEFIVGENGCPNLMSSFGSVHCK